MLFHKRATGTGFEIYFKCERFIFVGKCDVLSKRNGPTICSGRNISMFMARNSFFKIARATLVIPIAALQDVDIVHMLSVA